MQPYPNLPVLTQLHELSNSNMKHLKNRLEVDHQTSKAVRGFVDRPGDVLGGPTEPHRYEQYDPL